VINGLDIYYGIGAAAGVIGLSYTIYEKVRNRPKVRIADIDITHEQSGSPKWIRIKAINTGRVSFHILRVGLRLSNGYAYEYALEGQVKPRPGWLHKGGIPFETEFDYTEVKRLIMEQGTKIDYAYVVGEGKKEFKQKVPDSVNTMLCA